MENQIEDSSPDVNDWAIASFWLSICALVPYMIAGIVYYLERTFDINYYQAEFLLALFCLFWGVLVGLVSLIPGILAIWQIVITKSRQTGIRLAILGTTLGALAVTSNVLFCYLLLAAFMNA